MMARRAETEYSLRDRAQFKSSALGITCEGGCRTQPRQVPEWSREQGGGEHLDGHDEAACRPIRNMTSLLQIVDIAPRRIYKKLLKGRQMTARKPHYNPSQRTEAEDLQVQKGLDEASANQLAGLVDELLEEAEKDSRREEGKE